MFSTTQTNSPSSNGKTFVPFKASGTQVTAETPSKESSRGGSINDERRNISPNWGQMKQTEEIKKVEKYIKLTEGEEILEHEKKSPSIKTSNNKLTQAMYES